MGIFNFDTIKNYNINSFIFNANNDLIPTMTALDAPSPFVVSQNGYYDVYSGFYAFNKETTKGWYCNAAAGWIKIYTYNLCQINKVRIRGVDAKPENYPKDFTIQISTNDSDWTTVYTVTGANGLDNTYEFTPVNCKYIKIVVTATVGGVNWIRIGNITIYGINSNQP